jgi:cytochrome bd-type quinol oxidase subunit 2
MLTMYVMLDGYDLGVAAIGALGARTDRDMRAAMESIGPFWNGNEVWLIAAGGGALRALSEGLRLVVLGILSAVHHRAVAADVARHRDGAARAFRERDVASVLGRCVCGLSSALLI